MENKKSFGRIVRNLREKKGMTIDEASKLCALSFKGYEEVELGNSDPKLSTVLKIASVYEIDLGELKICVEALEDG